MKLTLRLLLTLGCSWLAFLIAGLLISQFAAIPIVPLLIDRSYCPAAQWQQVTQTYTDLYQQHQRQQLILQPVILFNHLDQTLLPSPPPPSDIQALSTYGPTDPQRQLNLQQQYAHAQILSCR